MAKVLLFLVLIGLGNLSRRVVRREYATSDQTPPAGRAQLRRTVLIEVLLAVGVLAVTGVLVAEPPGRALASASEQIRPRSTRADFGLGRSVTITIDPARRGTTTVTATVTGQTPQQLAVSASLPQRHLGPLPVPLRLTSAGSYQAPNVLLPAPGRWVFTVVARYSEFEAVTGNVDIVLS